MSDEQWRRRKRRPARPVRGVRRSAVPGRRSRHRRGVRRHGGAPAELRTQRHRTAPALDGPADGRGAAHGPGRVLRRRRGRRRRRVVVVHDRVARSGATTSTRIRRRIRAAASLAIRAVVRPRHDRRGPSPTRCPSRCRARRRVRSRSPRRHGASPAGSRSAPIRRASSGGRRRVAAGAAPSSQTALGPSRRVRPARRPSPDAAAAQPARSRSAPVSCSPRCS